MIQGLNSLRYLAFLFIFLFHTVPHFKLGYLGVDFFFVLSSFLLTYLGMKEVANKGRFNSFNFFMRRVLRIFPLYFLVLVVTFLLLPPIAESYGYEVSLPKQEALYWFFLSNYEVSKCLYPLKFLWSIAVEEQFYILFALSGWLIFRYVPWYSLLLFAVFFGFVAVAEANDYKLYTNTLTHFPKFAVGMLLGYSFYKSINLRVPALIFLLVSVPILILTKEIPYVFHPVGALFFGSIIYLVAVNSEKIGTLIIVKNLDALGQYTYGLYIYSGFALVASSLIFEDITSRYILAFCLTHVVAVLSYHLFEKPILRLKKHFK